MKSKVNRDSIKFFYQKPHRAIVIPTILIQKNIFLKSGKETIESLTGRHFHFTRDWMHNEGKEIKRVASLKHGTHLSMSNRILTNTIRAVARACKMHSVAHRSTFHHAPAKSVAKWKTSGRRGGGAVGGTVWQGRKEGDAAKEWEGTKGGSLIV